MEWFAKNLIQPISTRLGTMAAGAVVSYGVSADTANHVETAVTVTIAAVLLVVIDLVRAKQARTKLVAESLVGGK